MKCRSSQEATDEHFVFLSFLYSDPQCLHFAQPSLRRQREQRLAETAVRTSDSVRGGGGGGGGINSESALSVGCGGGGGGDGRPG
jgi:hypothetical protein